MVDELEKVDVPLERVRREDVTSILRRVLQETEVPPLEVAAFNSAGVRGKLL